MAKIYPVIMAGGSGTRLWPLSRQDQPKQFQKLVTDKTMLEETILRVGHRAGSYQIADPIIICGQRHALAVQDILKEANLTAEAIIYEPMGKNTAAVAIIASLYVQAQDPDGLILMLPADHHVTKPEGFTKAVVQAAKIASEGFLTTFGIKPTHAETGYGYIQAGSTLAEDTYRVAAFKEKPIRSLAEEYVQDGGYSWNAGVFMFQAATMLEEANAHAPDIAAQSAKAFAAAVTRSNTHCLCADEFNKVRSESIDYAIMEKTDRAAMVGPVEMGWNDIGSWQSLRDMISQTGKNVEVGDVTTYDCQNSYIRSEGPKVSVLGMDNVVVIVTADAVLVMPAEQSQEVKKIVDDLRKNDRTEIL